MSFKIASYFLIGGRQIEEDATNEQFDFSGPNQEKIIPEIHLKIKLNGVDVSETSDLVHINTKRNDESNRQGEHNKIIDSK